MTDASAEATGRTLREWDKAHVWHPFTARDFWEAREPLIIERGEGVWLFDDRGRRYLDGVASLWCNVHGHRHPKIDEAVRRQLDKLAHSTLLGASHEPAIRLAKRLTEIAPQGLTRVFFSDNGSTAVESALKIAFQYWRQKADPEPNRIRFLTVAGAYHGDTIGDVSLGGIDVFHHVFGPLLFPTLRVPTPHPYRHARGRTPEECMRLSLDAAERVLREHRSEVAAIVIEPLVQGAAGILVHPEGFLRGLHDLSRRYGVLLICDEVAVGFGRTGSMFACEQEGVSPDLLCLAKGITAGYLPLAATLATDAIYEAFLGDASEPKTFFHGHTFSGNPLAAAAALASLEVFEEEETLKALGPKIDHLARRLEEFRGLPHVGDVRQKGLLAGVEIVADKATGTPFPAAMRLGAEICMRARDFGVLIRPLGDVLVIMPPLCIAIEQIDLLLDVMKRCLLDAIEATTS